MVHTHHLVAAKKDCASAIGHSIVSQFSTYTAPCLGKVVHLKDLATVTKDLM